MASKSEQRNITLRNTTTRIIRTMVGEGDSKRELHWGGIDDAKIVGPGGPVQSVTSAEMKELEGRKAFKQTLLDTGMIQRAA